MSSSLLRQSRSQRVAPHAPPTDHGARASDPPPGQPPLVTPRTHRARWVAIPAVAVLFLAVPPLLQLPPRFIEGCAGWIVLAVVLDGILVLIQRQLTPWMRRTA